MASQELFSPTEREELDAWLAKHVPALGDGPLETAFITGGSSNIVVKLSRPGGRPLVLRKAPLHAPPASAKAIQREATVLRGLAGSSVPHPQFHGYCDDASVAGGPFYIMDLVDGWAATITPDDSSLWPPRFDGGPDQHYIGYTMIDGLIEMANFDYVAAGLATYGKPDNFLERQVERWSSQFRSYPERYPGFEGRTPPGMQYVSDWLSANIPSNGRPGLMHGDYAVNNVLFAHNPPARLVAIIDWETSTIGDPLMDLAGFTLHLRGPGGAIPDRSYLDPRNFPLREDAVAYYARMTGRDVSAIEYYDVLYKYRMACILEYKVAEAKVGLAPKEKGDRFDRTVQNLFAEAEKTARRLG